MAKVRVYELAKELNMTNNQLLDKIKELKIDAKSHMSALDKSAVTAIKQHLFGKKKRSNDVKVRPSVIRRRKAQSRSQADEPDVLETDDAASAEKEPETTENFNDRDPQVPVDSSSADEVEQTVNKKDEPEVQAKAPESEDAAGAEKEAVVKRPARKIVSKSSQPAKIIKPAGVVKPAEPEPESPSGEPQTGGAVAASPVLKDEADQKVSADKVEQEEDTADASKGASPSDSVAETQALESADTDKDLTDPEATDTQAGEPSTPSDGEAEGDDSTPAKRKKKKKKTTPAKIVRVADPTVLENLRKMTASDEKNHSNGNGQERNGRSRQSDPSAVKPDMGAQGLVIPDNFPKDRRRGWENPEPAADIAGPSRKKRRKKKAVVEGDDLLPGPRA